MRKNKFKPILFLLFSVIVLVLTPRVSIAESLTLPEFLAQVKKENPALEAVRARAQALEHRIAPIGTLDDPFVAAGVDQIPFSGSGGSVMRYQLSQAIPFPGKLGAKSDAAQRRADAASADAETASRTLIIIATQNFYRTYFNHKAITINEENRRYIQGTIESTKSRYKTGEASHHEWILGKIELGVLEVEKLRLKREQKSLHALLNELRNQPAQEPITLEDVHFDKDKEVESDQQKLLKNQPELRSSLKLSESAQADERSAKLTYAPDFVIQGMAMQPRSQDMGQGSNWGVMVGINLPVFFWRKQSELVSAAQADRESADLEKRSLENRLNTEVVDATEQLKTARSVVDLYKKDVMPLTVIAGKNARTGYAARRLPLTQLIEALKVERIQSLEFVAAQIDVELSKSRLENLLSSPPLIKFAPGRPTVFGGSGMGAGASGTVNMGSGMSGPTRRESKARTQETGSSGMGNM